VVKEMRPLWLLHWQEMALDRGRIQPDADEARYAALDQAGMLHLATARERTGRLVGYWVSFLLPHLHYKSAGLMAYVDMYWVMPAYRRGGCGAKLLLMVERSLQRRGVVKYYLSTKAHQDHGALFERLGWKLSDRVFTKIL
jgi:GNAT superfamily N-acetyltransferase